MEERIQEARWALDRHLGEILAWHFSPETGTPHWLRWARDTGFDPREAVHTVEDLGLFPEFDGELLRSRPHEDWIPRGYAGRPFLVFETGGTTGVPKQRLSWEDHRVDYEEFSRGLDPAAFPPGGRWLMVGPTGPRRLRVAIEHLAHVRGGICYHVDLDPRWVRKLLSAQRVTEAEEYKRHVVDQALALLRHRTVACMFTTPVLLEALAEKISLARAGIRGVFCGGTSMSPQTVRFLVEECLEGQVQLVPTYGNTLMGLAACDPVSAQNGYSVTYHAPQPRAVLRVVDPDRPDRVVEYGEWGRVELTTLTREFFMPRLLERDEAIRQPPSVRHPWDGVAQVRPLSASSMTIVEGVY